MSKSENPSAFPHADGPYGGWDRGMTLCDWFAGQALAGLLANKDAFGPHFQGDPEIIATAARTFADAMLQARQEAR